MTKELLEFYLKHTSETVDDPESSFYKPLHDAPGKAFRQLKKLCSANEDCMAKVLRLILRLPVIKRVDKYQKSDRGEQRKITLQRFHRSETRIYRCFLNIAIAVSPDDTTIRQIKDWASCQTKRKVYGGILPELALKKPGNLTKESKIFNGTLTAIFKIAQGANGDLNDNAIFSLIANLLDSFQIHKAKGTLYERQDLIKIINR